MKNLQTFCFAGIVALLSMTAGCSCGNSNDPTAGMSETDAKAAIDRMTPENKIKAIASSPLPQAEKDKRYAEIEQQTGVKASDVLSGGGGGQPGSGGGAPK